MKNHAPELACELADLQPAESFKISDSKSDLPAASLTVDGQAVALCSKYDPIKEATRMADQVDYSESATVFVMGIGLGYHVAEVSKRLGPKGLLIVWEPDPANLLVALTHVDHTPWLSRQHLIIFTGQPDRTTFQTKVEPYAFAITQGLRLFEHPAYRRLFPEQLTELNNHAKDIVAYARTCIATALVNNLRTHENLTANLPLYAAGASINELKDFAKGFPAVCVAAGPSLVKNVHLLQNPEIRKNIIVIAVQTALRPLLDRGITPDFVTALDYSQISARFYEDLPPLPTVTLVAEPKAHCTILDSYPGPVRTLSNEFNDVLLGDMATPKDSLPAGGTVAHLSLYLAQYIGCDPIMFIGQDLAFSDGLYYAPGTAVHQVWSSEINAHNTIEMMEYIRVMRMRGHLREATDHHGRTIYTDEQMATYHKQFERDFSNAPQTIIDATEGGLPKEHTIAMPFAESLEKHATEPTPSIPLPSTHLDSDRLSEVEKQIGNRMTDINELRQTTVQTIATIEDMMKNQRNKAKMVRLFDQLTEQREHATNDLAHAFNLITKLNVLGAYKRQKKDRLLEITTNDPYERQYKQLERDAENLDWIVQSCDEAITIFEQAMQRLSHALIQHQSPQPA
ncbi:motility associated factor glycosyltransferase family protein [Poriferisphaera corsica]|uniref:motility associated factor glycosyltransferase family protein n=1 Tax=Poriferisphaera corsica TaxID=2528020 RepID=UPI00190BAC0A|nr:6-hydroxymethylpterin diphosphokinase MptE-like protein [Poriferisphaera corsica]